MFDHLHATYSDDDTAGLSIALSCAVAPAPVAQTAEWVQKHRPQGLKDIAVAKKKVQEAQQWLEAFRDGAPHPAHPRMLLLTGGSGSRRDPDGKSACMHGPILSPATVS